jgi:hypothetical protein
VAVVRRQREVRKSARVFVGIVHKIEREGIAVAGRACSEIAMEGWDARGVGMGDKEGKQIKRQGDTRDGRRLGYKWEKEFEKPLKQ